MCISYFTLFAQHCLPEDYPLLGVVFEETKHCCYILWLFAGPAGAGSAPLRLTQVKLSAGPRLTQTTPSAPRRAPMTKAPKRAVMIRSCAPSRTLSAKYCAK